MRTTLTLDPDLARTLKDLADRRRQSFEETLDEIVRRGLATRPRATDARYTLEPHRGGFRPGIDPGKLNQLVDQVDVEDFIADATFRNPL
ncbi:MAG TPA: CopG family transcriptional regulator [Nannocystaceae bacterium]|nr:CopG family transcriptional regulator [Nannocystaceae bacterium]